MSITAPISPAVARAVLGYYDLPGGLVPGGFEKSLLDTFNRADSQNFAKLAQGFPEHAEALRAELQTLKEIAEQ